MKNSVRLAVALAFGAGGAAFAPFALAQQASEQVLERVEITGSIIKRAEAEGALPVQVITREQIEKLSITSASDLVQNLPAMQGFTTESTSVNGGGGGVTTASLHDLGAKYTLVLLNGQRIAAATTGTTVNLENLPLSIVERVEVLKDGASALYGSDAIAGVVNFITKKNSTDGSVSASFNHPVHGGGESGTFAISKGFGDLDKDGWNIMASLSHDEQTELRSNQRTFSATGNNRPFSYNGGSYMLYQTSVNSVPANVQVFTPDGLGGYNLAGYFSPYQLTNGSCPAGSFKAGTRCRFDYSANVEDVSPSRRTTGYLDAHFRLGESATGFLDVLLSQYDMIPRYAPPAQPLSLAVGGTLWNKDIVPLINAGKIANPTTGAALANADLIPGSYAGMYVRVYDAGGRTDDYGTYTMHLAGGVDGRFRNWDYKATYIHSATTWTDTAKGGYVSYVGMNNLIAAGKYDPLMNPAGTSDLSSIILRDRLDTQRTFLDTLKFEGSHDLFAMGGGSASVGVGLEFDHTRQSDDPSQILQTANAFQPNYPDSIVGGGAGNLPYAVSRENYGVFAELLLPVTKSFEATASVRYDGYGKVKNSLGYGGLTANGFTIPVGAQDQGITSNKATYKISLRFQPVQQLGLRGSYGTGFRAPAISDIATPTTFYGSTAGTYQFCPFYNPANPASHVDPSQVASTALSVGCQQPGAQYDLLNSGNPASDSTALKPETSKQFTMGIVFEPTRNISFVADYWQVKLSNQISSIPEALGFANPASYQYLFRVITDPTAQLPYLAFTIAPINLSESKYRGIDWDVRYSHDTMFGKFVVDASGTHLLQADYYIPGDGWETSLGKYGADLTVAFRDIIRLGFTLNTGSFAHSLTANYKSSYKDQSYASTDRVIFATTAAGGRGAPADYSGTVQSYTLWDWQSTYHATKALDMSLGVKNLFDRRPPFSAVTGGGGNQVGYDARYADALLRQIYARVKYVF